MFARNDKSILAKWWFSIDKISLAILFLLMAIGIILNFSATPITAKQFGYSQFYFIKRYIAFLIPSILFLIFLPSLTLIQIRKISFLLFLISLILLILTPFLGIEIKGAKRWLLFFGNSIQISEFLKPSFTIFSAWLLAKQFQNNEFKGFLLSFLLLSFIVFFLLLQPDIGMSLIFIATWFCQVFIVGIGLKWIILILAITPFLGLTSYFIFPHVANRIELFFSLEQYQVTKSLQAIAKGGVIGLGPAGGKIKKSIPDVYSDFIYAIAGEEFGFISCIFIIFLYFTFVTRCFLRVYNSKSMFTLLATIGLASQIAMQSIINIASCIGIIPTKGMALPFISYGGSSILALSISCSLLLCITKKCYEYDRIL